MAWYYKRLAKQRRGKDVVMRASGASELENFAFYNPKAAIFWQSFVGRFSRYELRNDIFFVLQVLTNLKCTDKTKKKCIILVGQLPPLATNTNVFMCIKTILKPK